MYLKGRNYSLGGKMKFVREKIEKERDLSFVSSKGVLAIFLVKMRSCSNYKLCQAVVVNINLLLTCIGQRLNWSLEPRAT